MKSVLFLLPSFTMDAHLLLVFTFRSTKHSEITSQQHLYTPSPASPPHPTRSLPRTELSSELRPPDPTISESDEGDLASKLGENRMTPKMRKWWTHRGIEAMKEAVTDNREVAPESEEHPGMVGPGIHSEKSCRSVGYVFFPS